MWVSAYLRQVETGGACALLVRRGETTAGAIYVKVAKLDGTAFLYSPALLLDETSLMERGWQSEFGPAPLAERDIDAFLKNQTNFDADIWIIEVEDPEGRHFLGDQLQEL